MKKIIGRISAGTYKLNATIPIICAILLDFVRESQLQGLVARLRNFLRVLEAFFLMSITHYQHHLHLALSQVSTTSYPLRK